MQIRIRGDSRLVGQWKGEGLGAGGQEEGGREQRGKRETAQIRIRGDARLASVEGGGGENVIFVICFRHRRTIVIQFLISSFSPQLKIREWQYTPGNSSFYPCDIQVLKALPPIWNL